MNTKTLHTVNTLIKEYKIPHPLSSNEKTEKRKKPPPQKITYLGIDGEGTTEHFGPWPGKHRYTMLCVASEKINRVTELQNYRLRIENEKGLSTLECLDFITSIPSKIKGKVGLFAYSFGYDLTKILEDVDDLSLFKLVRPELRRRVQPNGNKISIPVYWPSNNPQYSLDWINGRFTVRKLKGKVLVIGDDGQFKAEYQWEKGVVIHDIWKFFQGKFTNALKDWKVPDRVSKEERKRLLDEMRDMKDKRSKFDQLDTDQIRNYCFSECEYMATLARKLTEAHITAGIPLKNYFGAGSSAEAMMLTMNIKAHIKQAREENPPPENLDVILRCAFFGGRFELSWMGSLPTTVFSYDLSSAYVYQLTFLPCLVHGRWERTDSRLQITDDRCRTAIVHYSLSTEPLVKRSWAPFPFRTKDGSITYPETSGGGWVWRDEYLAGEQLFDNVGFQEAWVYHCDCDCQPFKDIPQYYAYRILIGKEGPGIVVKLGMNSNYGKTAQTIGGEPGSFHSWVWAGLITSGCRAQILTAMAAHSNLDNLLMVATDGIASLERLTLNKPLDTGTSWLECPEPNPKDVKENPELFKREGNKWLVNKPLGGWEEKIVEKGYFLARPGIYFPLDPSEDDIEKVRARGLGRKTVYDHWRQIVEAYESGKDDLHIGGLSLFRGIKTSITRGGKAPNYTYTRQGKYGRWEERGIDMSFNPKPKRESKLADGRLTLRKMTGESEPYNKGVPSPEALAIFEQQIQDSEQPDGGDLTDCSWSADE